MKPASLSLRLGLTMSILGALLVMFLAVLAYFALTHELNTLSRDSLASNCLLYTSPSPRDRG